MSVAGQSNPDPLLAQRVATAVVGAVAVVTGIFALPAGGVAAVGAVVAGLAAWEWSRLAGITGTELRLAYVAVVVLVGGTAYGLVGGATAIAVMAVATAWWLGFAGWLMRGGGPRTHDPGVRWGWLAVGVISLAALVLAFGVLAQPGPFGRWLLLYAVCLVWVADIGAYFVGRALGRHKLAPKVSGGKTREGAAGAVAAVAVFAWVAGVLLGVSGPLLPLWCGSAVAAAALSIVGDLGESVIKREAGVKDSGRMLPGHGGLFDRIDSLVAGLPALVLALMVFGLAGW